MEQKQHYEARLRRVGEELEQVKQRILRISLLRLALFVTGAAGVYAAYGNGVAVGMVLAGTVLAFLVLVKYHNRLFLHRDWLEACLRVNREELAALAGDYTPFDGGDEYADPSHRYAFDIDLFGKRSLFQALNRTCTSSGRAVLSGWLKEHLEDRDAILLRQEAVRELAGGTDFREAFRITGLLSPGNADDRREIAAWTAAPSRFSSKRWCRMAVVGVPTVNVLLIVLAAAGIVPLSVWGIVCCMFLTASFGLVRRVTMLQSSFDKHLRILSVYARLAALVERQPWQSPLLAGLRQRLRVEGKDTNAVLGELTTELARLDLRNNQLLYVVLEGMLFWQLRQMIRIERWRERYGACLIPWIDTLGELDALCSLATFAYNHPRYAYPSIATEPFVFRASGMGHPLMPEAQCVANDADIPSRPFFVIITGANMAGKSTYLRTIGVNYVLACIGAPVCCTSLELYPARLVTSLRTSDSLTDNESYFFAELKRLKQILDRLDRGEVLFIILDEILKGTNSLDKQKGSFALIRQLMRLRANGIIATHDLLLGQLAAMYPEEIRNGCFEADITGDELTFSYKLRPGVAHNMNACFLMQKMGLIIND